MEMSVKVAEHSSFVKRHIGPQSNDQELMLRTIGCSSMGELIRQTVPSSILLDDTLPTVPPGVSEEEALNELRIKMSKNKTNRSHIGIGFYDTHVPAVILRNMIENPSWYTPYTPYQPEISQGRLEMLLNFQTMVSDLTHMDICNSSLLDEATAGAEAVMMAFNIQSKKKQTVLMSSSCHPQTAAVTQTRCEPMGIDLKVLPEKEFDLSEDVFAIVLQCPGTFGEVDIVGLQKLAERAKELDILVIVGTDLLACTMLPPPGEWGADMVYGHSQRFGVPLGFGGPHAGFLATRDEFKRKLPGRIIGVSKDAEGKRALRMSLQTREQHIRRDKATSNVCTAQALLANVSAAFGIWHGPHGLKKIAERTHSLARKYAGGCQSMGFEVVNAQCFFDTVHIRTPLAKKICAAAERQGINLRLVDDSNFTVAMDETTTGLQVDELLTVISAVSGGTFERESSFSGPTIPLRESEYMRHHIFNSVKSETDLMRYLYKLERKDLGLNTAMIPLGSCTMKLNAASEMIPITWESVNRLHPFSPIDQAEGYTELLADMNKWLAEMTGFAGISFQSNSGAQGEYSGLMCIRQYHVSRNEGDRRKVCLIPTSAHGTNPASAVFAGLKVVTVKCATDGGIDLEDFRKKAEKYTNHLSSCMVTYPSTHGCFEETVKEICDICHEHGGLVYMDGANFQAQVGFCSPGSIGADVCHLNLHKTFCIPHGGGGPGMGPIGVVEKLLPFLPSHPLVKTGGDDSYGTISSAPYSSTSILPISWMYIRMMGREGIKAATACSILNANYMAKKLGEDFKVLYTGSKGRVAHEFILDLRELKKSTGITESDVAKRLMDFGFHAPTMSWPVPGTLMVEPTESESLYEMNRFIEAMQTIRNEIADVEDGKISATESPLRYAPHTAEVVTQKSWGRMYPREQGIYPVPSLRENKFWPTVSRIDDVYGDKNLICSCPPLSDYE